MVAGVVAATGWGWEQCENELDIPRLAALNRAWEELPPISAQLVRFQHYFGIAAPKKAAVVADDNDAEVGQMLAASPKLQRTVVMTPEEFMEKHGGR